MVKQGYLNQMVEGNMNQMVNQMVKSLKVSESNGEPNGKIA
jgi:hypothetical protein